MIPNERIVALTRAMNEALGTSEYDEMRTLSKSRTAQVLRLVVKGRPYLLRIIERIGDTACECQFTAMRSAAAAGLAPHVWYTSLEDRISITDFVQAVPLSQNEALVLMPSALRTLHALPPFPPREDSINTSCTFLLGKGTALEALLQRVQTSNYFPDGENERLFDWYEKIAAVYPRHDSEMVSSHNDLVRPSNILFDGEKVWLIDWEAAFLNDRYSELAVVANFVVRNAEQEWAYLREYFGRSPDEYEHARYYLMQQVAHMFYAMVYLMLGSAGKPVEWNEAAPDFDDFHRRVWTGEADMEDSRMKIAYGKAHWQRLLNNMAQTRFAEALMIVSDRHRSG